MSIDLFEFEDYKSYLNQRLDTDPQMGGRGARAHFARAINCQTSYVAHVLKGKAHLSPEQAESANQFFSHSEEESLFFHLLVSYARSGTSALSSRIKKQIATMKSARLNLANRLSVKAPGIKAQDQAFYYSSWIYLAIHAAVSLPGLQTSKAIAHRFRLPQKQVQDAVDFLLRVGFLSMSSGVLAQGETRMHLPGDSPLISKHHSNWRVQAIASLDRREETDLHYSSVVTVSSSDASKIRESIVQMITSSKKMIRDSSPETLRVFSADFFQLS